MRMMGCVLVHSLEWAGKTAGIPHGFLNDDLVESSFLFVNRIILIVKISYSLFLVHK